MAHVPHGLRPPVMAPGGLRTWLGRGQLGRARLLDRVLAELLQERERWPLWLPVAVGTGIALYFALPAEPPAWLAAAPILPLALLLLVRRLAGGAPAATLLIALTLAALGFAAAEVRTQQVEAPVLERRGAYVVEGRVALVEEALRGHRLLLAGVALEGVPPERTPALVRFSLRTSEQVVRPGDRVRARVMLMPPSPPAGPGNFDFARQAYFQRLGAVG